MTVFWLLGIAGVLLQTVSQTVFWPLWVVLLAAGLTQNVGRVYVLAWGLGIVTDLALGRTLGESAVFLLLACAGIHFYRSGFRLFWLVFLVYGVILNLVTKLLWG